MRKQPLITILLVTSFLLGSLPLFAQRAFSLEEKLYSDIRDHKLDDFSHVEAAFILSGVNHADSLQYYARWYDELVEKIKSFHFDAFDHVGSAEKVFNYIRATLFEEYRLEATTLLDIVHDKKYNCVSSTILYNLVCEEFGWRTEAFETPTHVYTIFSNFGRHIMVENTHPMGFNILSNLHVYSRYLAQFYPEDQVLKIGLDRLYAHENSKGRVINNTELLGLLAYNQAFFASKKKDFETAYNLVLVAQDFNRDSRSNINFEIGLYYRWGKLCFSEKRFYDAFEVFADGYYRYPDNEHFAKNTRAAFYNTLQDFWKAKNWQQSRQVIDEMLELEILEKNDLERLQPLMKSWASYHNQIGNQSAAQEALTYFDTH